jgi:prepilin-type N-terminal cleavage/methylation domain-containing protein
MKKIYSKTRFKRFLPFGNSAGFTMLEVLASMVILSVGILGLATTVNSVIRYQEKSKDLTLATMHTTAKLEEIRRAGTNDPTGGVFSFQYLVDDSAAGFMDGYADPGPKTRSQTDAIDGYNRTWVITVFPANAPADQNFTDATGQRAINMVNALVTTTWVDDTGNDHSVQASTVLHKRRFF